MRHGHSVYLFVLVSGLLLSGDLDAGSLEPPGPPAPTMKALDQVEARIPISSVPFSITQPGSYYLTRDLTGASGQAGITVTASFVTLDLNGFALIGVPGSLGGISIPGITEHIEIRNGVIRNWGGRGIGAVTSTEVHIADLRIDANGSDGLAVGSRGSVRDTSSTSNAGSGFFADSNSTVTRCTAALNGGGFLIGSNSVVSNSTAQGNTGPGFSVAQGSLVTDCTAQQNTTSGFQLTNGGSRIFRSVARANAVGISGGEMGTVEACTVEVNTDDGIRIGNRGIVRGNLTRSNTNDGIDGSGTEARIEDNLSTLNGVGIRLTGTNNLLVKNNVSANSTAFSVAAGNKVGQVTSDPNTANPWGNFSL